MISQMQTNKIREIRAKIRELNVEDWDCEGYEDDYGRPCNIFFNNKKDESFTADFDGNPLWIECTMTMTKELKEMAKLYGQISKIVS